MVKNPKQSIPCPIVVRTKPLGRGSIFKVEHRNHYQAEYFHLSLLYNKAITKVMFLSGQNQPPEISFNWPIITVFKYIYYYSRSCFREIKKTNKVRSSSIEKSFKWKNATDFHFLYKTLFETQKSLLAKISPQILDHALIGWV